MLDWFETIAEINVGEIRSMTVFSVGRQAALLRSGVVRATLAQILCHEGFMQGTAPVETFGSSLLSQARIKENLA